MFNVLGKTATTAAERSGAGCVHTLKPSSLASPAINCCARPRERRSIAPRPIDV